MIIKSSIKESRRKECTPIILFGSFEVVMNAVYIMHSIPKCKWKCRATEAHIVSIAFHILRSYVVVIRVPLSVRIVGRII